MLETQSVASIPAETREPRVFDLRYLPWGSLLIIALLVFVALGAPLLTSYSPIEQALPDKLLPPAWEKGESRAPAGYGHVRTRHAGTPVLRRQSEPPGHRLISACRWWCGAAHRSPVRLYWRSGRYRADAHCRRGAGLPNRLVRLTPSGDYGARPAHADDCHRALVVVRFARVMRGEVLAVRTRDFVALARGAGVFALAHHAGPHSAERHEHFYGLADAARRRRGISRSLAQFPRRWHSASYSSWGQMVAEGRGKIASAWWLSLLPGLAITLVVLAFNLFGDWLRDRLDPKLRQL